MYAFCACADYTLAQHACRLQLKLPAYKLSVTSYMHVHYGESCHFAIVKAFMVDLLSTTIYDWKIDPTYSQ